MIKILKNVYIISLLLFLSMAFAQGYYTTPFVDAGTELDIGKVVKVNSSGQLLYCGDNDPDALGVISEKEDVGGTFYYNVETADVVIAALPAGITALQDLTTSISGGLRAAATGEYVIGIALENGDGVGTTYERILLNKALSSANSSGWTDDGAYVRLDNPNDLVGIGTATPSQSLDINGALRLEASIGISSAPDTSGVIWVKEATSAPDTIMFWDDENHEWLAVSPPRPQQKCEVTGGGNTDCNPGLTAIPFATEVRVDDIYTRNPSFNSRVYVDYAGYYTISYQIPFHNNVSGRVVMHTYLRKNGSTDIGGDGYCYMRNATIADETCNGVSYLIYLDANDYVEVVAEREAGNNGTTYAKDGECWLLVENETNIFGGGSGTPASGDITAVGSMTSGDAFTDNTADGDWLGLGATEGRFYFGYDASGNDTINVLGANFGIGVTSPLEQVHIGGGILIGNTVNTNPGTIRWNGTNFQGYNGVSWINLDHLDECGWTDDGNIVRLTTSDDSVGVGTTIPSQKMDIVGNIELNNYLYFLNNTTEYLRNDGSNFILSNDFLPTITNSYSLGSNNFRWSSIYMNDTLNIGISGDQSMISYSTSGDFLQFQNTADVINGFQFLDADGGNPILNIDTQNERVGIGLSDPVERLEIDGNVLISNTGTAGELILNEPFASGSNFTSFKAVAQDVNLAYSLPDTQGVEHSVLSNDGAGNLEWAPLEDVAANIAYNVTVIVTSSYSADPEDNHVIVNNTSPATISLPSASTLRGKVYFIKKISAGGGPRDVYIDPAGSETIDGSLTYTLNQLYEGVMIVSDESNWYIMSEVAP